MYLKNTKTVLNRYIFVYIYFKSPYLPYANHHKKKITYL